MIREAKQHFDRVLKKIWSYVLNSGELLYFFMSSLR